MSEQAPERLGNRYAIYGPFTDRGQARSARRDHLPVARAQTLEAAARIADTLLCGVLEQQAAFVCVYDDLGATELHAAEMTHASRPEWNHNGRYWR